MIPRIAPLLVAAVALTACGSDDPAAVPLDPPGTTTGDATGDATGAELRAPTPVEVASGGGAGTAAAPAVAESDVASSEMRIAPWSVVYVIGDGMPALPTDDTGYVYDGGVSADAAQVAALASALGVAGDPVRVEDEFAGSWRVGPDDGSAPSLWVYDDAQLSWNFNAAWGDVRVAEACAVSVDSEGNESSDCPEPEPPVGVPSADEAQQRASDVLAALGVDTGSLTFDTFADEWFASVTASQPVDDRAAVRSWGFGFGAEGVLQYANGSLATPAPVGPYPLVDLETAVARLSDGFYGGFGGVAGPDIAVMSEPAPAPIADGEPGEVVDPMPVEPGDPITVTLVDVQPDLWWAWDVDGSAWLLPAYRFIDTDGGWHVAPAVTDEFLIQAEPVVGEPIPVEGDGGIGDGAEPLPTPEPVEPDEPVEIEPGTDPEGALPTLEAWVGLSVEEFTANAESIGFATRVVELDGEPLAGTADYRTDRVNVVVEGPRVVAIESIG